MFPGVNRPHNTVSPVPRLSAGVWVSLHSGGRRGVLDFLHDTGPSYLPSAMSDQHLLVDSWWTAPSRATQWPQSPCVCIHNGCPLEHLAAGFATFFFFLQIVPTTLDSQQRMYSDPECRFQARLNFYRFLVLDERNDSSELTEWQTLFTFLLVRGVHILRYCK